MQICHATARHCQDTVRSHLFPALSKAYETATYLQEHRMQSLEARKIYKNSFVCGAKIGRDEGILALWSGALPRLARLVMSGGIVFTMYATLAFHSVDVRMLIAYCRYEKSMQAFDTLDPDRIYI